MDETPQTGAEAGAGAGGAAEDGTADQSPTLFMRFLGFVFFFGAVAAAVSVGTGSIDGGWRTNVFVAGIGISVLLGGLALNGWVERVCIALAWVFPATLLYGAVLLLVDPSYGSFLDGSRTYSDSEIRGIGGIFLVAGAAGLAGYVYAVRRRFGNR
ncbi:hypothetical protein ACFQ07_28585 [Actinomadura adrarensis]|uniref:Integral membrane protein n=1 Tax=Actinomadura adrarensis TaxID=1819600 RepID=A0ABW3CQM6_9ACTN